MSVLRTPLPAGACGVRSRPTSGRLSRTSPDSPPPATAPFLHRPARMGSHGRLAGLALVMVALGGCFIDYDFANTSFACSDGVCPSGYECVAARCVAPSTGGDEGDGADAATSSPPDAALPLPDGAAQLQTCDQQFGASTGYQLCAETETTCEFFHLADGTPEACSDVCATYLATCVVSYNSTLGTECTRGEEQACTTTRGSQICVCSRGDG
jgi:hypothetical protein